MNSVSADYSQVKLDIIRCKLLYLFFQNNNENNKLACFCVGVKISRSYWGRNIGLRVFGNRVPRRIFGAKRDKVT
jgi:hypothetical protein